MTPPGSEIAVMGDCLSKERSEYPLQNRSNNDCVLHLEIPIYIATMSHITNQNAIRVWIDGVDDTVISHTKAIEFFSPFQLNNP